MELSASLACRREVSDYWRKCRKLIFVRWHGPIKTQVCQESRPNNEWWAACDLDVFMLEECDKQDNCVPEMLA